MISVSLKILANVLQAELHSDVSDINESCIVNKITTDTREISAGSLFIALKGERFDGHDFAEQAAINGATALVVSRVLPVSLPQLKVADTRIALGQLGAWMRQQATARVVGLTGSSGKTSVKEMTASILRECGNVLYTSGNLNNDIGVPLTLLRLTPQHDFAVIEMGANHIGEIAYTAALVKPEAALVNNLAAAHLEGFGSLAGVAQAKGEIFDFLPPTGTAIINDESNDWPRWQQKIGQNQRVWRFSPANANCDFSAREIKHHDGQLQFVMLTPEGAIDIQLPLPGYHNVANALAAAALSMSVGAKPEAIKKGLSQLKPVPGRLYPIRLSPHKLMLDDTYNANVGSMTAAARVLSEFPGYKIMVVGDMGELGHEAENCHRQVGTAIKAVGIDKVLSVGSLSRFISESSSDGEHFQNKSALTERLITLLSEQNTVTVLVKGSRSAAMEHVVQGIQEVIKC